MKEATAKALKIYKTILKSKSLEEGSEYKVNFVLNSRFGKKKISVVKPTIHLDEFEISPQLIFECYNDKKEYVSEIAFVEPKVILDSYDASCIVDVVEDDIRDKDYSIKLFDSIIDKFSLVL